MASAHQRRDRRSGPGKRDQRSRTAHRDTGHTQQRHSHEDSSISDISDEDFERRGWRPGSDYYGNNPERFKPPGRKH